jgi:DNA end-binding protein Ku
LRGIAAGMARFLLSAKRAPAAKTGRYEKPKRNAMRAIWKGAISFGLVNIPIALYPAVRTEDLKFRLLRASDHSPVDYRRVAEADGKEVPWDQIVKGYEYEKGRFVVLKEDDFKRVDVEATQTVNIAQFVKLEEVNPIFFHKPYYMEPQKGGDKAYVLLREALRASGKIAIAKVVIKTREHLAAVKPQEKGLMLELMHFATELRDVDEFKLPATKEVGKKELNMATALVDSMSAEWKPEQYVDDYREALEKVIEEKIKKGGRAPHKAAKRMKPTNVIDLVSVLQRSLDQSGKAERRTKPKSAQARKPRRKAA